jgi:hypothetical protein
LTGRGSLGAGGTASPFGPPASKCGFSCEEPPITGSTTSFIVRFIAFSLLTGQCTAAAQSQSSVVEKDIRSPASAHNPTHHHHYLHHFHHYYYYHVSQSFSSLPIPSTHIGNLYSTLVSLYPPCLDSRTFRGPAPPHFSSPGLTSAALSATFTCIFVLRVQPNYFGSHAWIAIHTKHHTFALLGYSKFSTLQLWKLILPHRLLHLSWQQSKNLNGAAAVSLSSGRPHD